MKKLLLLFLFISTFSFAQTRIFKGQSLPTTTPNNFQVGKDVFLRLSDTTFWDRTGTTTLTWTTSTYNVLKPKNGKDGLPGKDGINGISITGPQGPKGDTGIQGPPGSGSGSASYQSERWVSSSSELKQALLDAEAFGYPGRIKVAKSFTITEEMPWPLRPMMLELDGVNQQVRTHTPSGNVFNRRATTLVGDNVPTASETMIDAMPFVHDIEFKDDRIDVAPYTVKGTLFNISSTYVAVFERCKFTGYDSALVLPRAMDVVIQNNRFSAQKTIGIYLTYKQIPGGGPSTSQPNMSTIRNNVFRVEYGASAALFVEGGSGSYILQNIVEGDGGVDHHTGSDYGFILDYAGSPNVKSFTEEMNHKEIKFTKAATFVRIGDGNYFNNKEYGQYENVAVETNVPIGSGTPVINYSNPDFCAPGTTFLWGGGVFNFNNTKYSFNEQLAKYWKDSKICPIMFSTGYTGEGADNYPWIRTFGAGIKLNGKNIVTQ